jgi:hypothetical protein
LLDNSNIVIPTSGVKISSKLLAGRATPVATSNSGFQSALQSAIFRQKICWWNPPGNSNTVPGIVGFQAASVVGTATSRTVATTNVLTRAKRLAYVSNNGNGSFAAWRMGQAQFTTGDGAGLGGFFTSMRFAFSDASVISGTRAFVGMTSRTAAPTNVDPATQTNQFGVAQLSSDLSQLYFVYGGSTAQTAIPLGSNFPPMLASGADYGVLYDLTLYSPPNQNGVVHYMLERIGTSYVASGTITPSSVGVQTPSSSVLLTHQIWRTNNANSGAVAIDISNIYIETDY